MHTKGPSVHDTEWRAMEMGSEGWAVFVGPRMIASHLSEANARLIKQAPAMLKRLEEARDAIASLDEDALGSGTASVMGSEEHWPIRDELLDYINKTIRKARGE